MLVVVRVVTPLTPSVELAVKAPVTATVEPAVKAPVISTASAIVTFDESLESKVVPLTLSELKTTSPVPPGVILISAFEADEIILSCIVKLSMFVVVKVVTPETPRVELKVAAPVTPNVLANVVAPSTIRVPVV